MTGMGSALSWDVHRARAGGKGDLRWCYNKSHKIEDRAQLEYRPIGRGEQPDRLVGRRLSECERVELESMLQEANCMGVANATTPHLRWRTSHDGNKRLGEAKS